MNVFIYSSALLLCFSVVEAQQILTSCYRTENTSDVQYRNNLNVLIPLLASNAVIRRTTYYSTTVGSGAHRIYGFAQCMSAATETDCRACFNRSTADILSGCQNSTKAVMRNYNCTLRYSNESFISVSDTGMFVYFRSGENATDADEFDPALAALMTNLSSLSSADPSRFAVQTASYANFLVIYGMAQCTRDLSSNDCFICLRTVISFIPQCCRDMSGADVYVASCNVRFQTDPFYPANQLPSPPGGDSAAAEPAPSPSLPGIGGGSKHTRTTVIIVVTSSVGILATLITIWGFCRCQRKKRSGWRPVDAGEVGVSNSKFVLFDAATLRAATCNFSDMNELGKGGFGTVYKGKLPDGNEIAVKRLLTTSKQGIRELRNEVTLLAKLRHRNLVGLLGCCIEEKEKLLVYEYVPNASLDKFLFRPDGRTQLNWDIRHKIIEGIVRGLLYLHEDSPHRIIHRDLKASNILLDADLKARISDFGLAKLFEGDETHGRTSQPAGTFGYMAPEYIMRGHFSTKSDVFSFGVLVLEIVIGRQNAGFCGTDGGIDLLGHVWRHWVDGTAINLVDTSLGEDRYRPEVSRCLQLGLLCVQEDVAARPDMSAVTLMLTVHSMSLPMPSPPAFVSAKSRAGSNVHTSNSDLLQSQSSQGTESTRQSTNDVSITQLYPR